MKRKEGTKMKDELTETLIRALHEYVDAELDASGEDVDLVRRLLHSYGLSDETISAVGLDETLPAYDEPEPNEPPKKKYTVRIREIWTGTFEVEASDDDEAFELACNLEYGVNDLVYTDRDVFVEEKEGIK